MTGISTDEEIALRWPDALQWGPVVVTGIRSAALELAALVYELQWGVVTGIRPPA